VAAAIVVSTPAVTAIMVTAATPMIAAVVVAVAPTVTAVMIAAAVVSVAAMAIPPAHLGHVAPLRRRGLEGRAGSGRSLCRRNESDAGHQHRCRGQYKR
jgi:hypothetical protein